MTTVGYTDADNTVWRLDAVLGWIVKAPNGQYLGDDFTAGPREKASVYARAWDAGDDAEAMTEEAIRRGIAPENAEYLVEQVRFRVVVL